MNFFGGKGKLKKGLKKKKKNAKRDQSGLYSNYCQETNTLILK